MGVSIRWRWCVTVFLVFAGVALSLGQDGVSTAGEARTKYLGSVGAYPKPDEVAVEDFVNYPRHELPRPRAGDAVALDVRWGSTSVARNGDAILQIGMATALAHDRARLRPVNLSLVIDKSGSMAESNKLTRVKEALLALLGQLRPSDTLSIVAFDSDASVILPSHPLGTGEAARQAIESLEPGSSTNLEGGLVLGYKEAFKHLRRDATNRVILLTDGIANQGITDPDVIAHESLSYNDRGIDLSTIGVGLDLNKDLLQNLAKSGRGLYHFVSDSEDIKKVFVDEVQSLVAPVATEPDLIVDFGPSLKLDHIYGFDPKVTGHTVRISLDNMNSGMTEVVLMRFKAPNASEGSFPVHVRLAYHDIDKNRRVEMTQEASISVSPRTLDVAEDDMVAKNYTIAQLAQSIHDMAVACQSRRYGQAEELLNASISETYRRYPNVEDTDVSRTLAIALKYQAVVQRDARANREDRSVNSRGSDANLIPNGDFSSGNEGFTSGLPYVKPAYNCLWPVGYTVAPTWNNPLLHRLFAPETFAAPSRAHGGEQVLYANSGVAGALVVWTTSVKVKPHTRYRISFRSQSLNGETEWVPYYEITVNGYRSRAQQAGFKSFGTISTVWDSGDAQKATVGIVRMPIVRGGLIAIANIEMLPEAAERSIATPGRGR